MPFAILDAFSYDNLSIAFHFINDRISVIAWNLKYWKSERMKWWRQMFPIHVSVIVNDVIVNPRLSLIIIYVHQRCSDLVLNAVTLQI